MKDSKTTEPAAVKGLLADALADLLRPLEKPLVIGEHQPTVIMVAGVNGAGKTTSIGKLTKHLADHGESGAAGRGRHLPAQRQREQLAYGPRATRWRSSARRGGDPAAVSFDAVTAGRARAARTWCWWTPPGACPRSCT